MPKLTCPACGHGLALTAVTGSAPPAPPKRSRDITPLNDAALRLIFEFMKEVGPGSYSNEVLNDKFAAFCADRGRRLLGQQALSKGLIRQGAQRWRTSTSRGFHIDEIAADAAPHLMTDAARKRYEAAQQAGWVEANRAPQAEKPFDPLELVELPV